MLEHLVLLPEVLVELQHSSDVPAPVAVIRRAPDGDDRLVEHELEALHRELVRARDEVDRVVVRERLRDVGAEQEAGPARGEAPAGDLWDGASAWEGEGKGEGGAARRVPSGSDHRRSHIGPSCGTSCFLSMARICV